MPPPPPPKLLSLETEGGGAATDTQQQLRFLPQGGLSGPAGHVAIEKRRRRGTPSPRLSAPSPPKWTVRGGPRRPAPWSDSHSPTAPHALRPALSQPRQFRPDFARPPPPGGGITAAGSSASESPPMNGGRSACISPFGAHSLSLLRQFPSRAYLNHFSLRCCGAGRGCHARPSRRQGLPAEGVVSDSGYDRHQDSRRHHRRDDRRGPAHDFV